MPTDVEQWNAVALLDEFMDVEQNMPDRAFCFVLGAGASVTSGIPAGRQLVNRWLQELQRQLDPRHEARPVSEWATAETLGIPGFELDRREAFYPQVYERRYRHDRQKGHAALEQVMEGRDPSFGYSVLARVLATTRHRVVITTNFDNLVADALYIYTRKHPFVCGHESLTGFVRANTRVPLIAKIHRDLFLAPKNTVEDVAALAPGWAGTLEALLRHYTPIVIGYGGNDGSLMGFLRDLPAGSIPGTMFWCYREPDGPPGDEVKAVLSRHGGVLVPVVGFDELMLQLSDRLKLELLADEVERRARERADSYRRSVEELQRRLSRPVESTSAGAAQAAVRQALDATIQRQVEQPKDWWGWDLKARAEADPERRIAVYREALRQLPRSAELVTNFAISLEQDGGDPDEIERLFRQAIALAPDDVKHVGNLADHLYDVGHHPDEAEALYRRALALDPREILYLVHFAMFVRSAHRDDDEAERLLRQALEIDPWNGFANVTFAGFMARVRGDLDQAERHLQRAVDATPDYPSYLLALGYFRISTRRNPAEAEPLCERALELDPEGVFTHGGLVPYLVARGRLPEARVLAARAWERSARSNHRRAAVLALYRGMLLRLSGGGDASALGRLKTLLSAGFGRSLWGHAREVMFDAAAPSLSEADVKLYGGVADAIEDDRRVGDLAGLPRWSQVAAVPIDLSWPMDPAAPGPLTAAG